MKKIATYLVLAVFGAATLAWGYSSYLSEVPNSNAFRCNTCHKEKKFYQDFKNNGKTWNRALAIKDSDGDGATNGVELQDPNGRWRKGQSNPSIPGWSTYNPDDRTSRPPYTPVMPTSMGRVKALFK